MQAWNDLERCSLSRNGGGMQVRNGQSVSGANKVKLGRSMQARKIWDGIDWGGKCTEMQDRIGNGVVVRS